MITDAFLQSLPTIHRGSDRNTFTYTTVHQRYPTQVRRVIADNTFSAEINAQLMALAEEIPHAKLTPLTTASAAGWTDPTQSWWQETWASAPWLLSETYLYQRLNAIIGWEHARVDPFALQKRQSWLAVQDDVSRMTQALQVDMSRPIAETLPQWLAVAMWGNQADLGLFPIGTERPQTSDAQQAAATLVDDRQAAVAYLLSSCCQRIDLLLDNYGLELFSDLCLCVLLLANDVVDTIVLHCKRAPWFVSDALMKDVHGMVTLLAQSADSTQQQLAATLQAFFAAERIQLVEPEFWMTPQPNWQMPTDFYAELASADLIISKGDLNYRRWLGDRRWLYTTPVDTVIPYAPAPLLCLRTFKSELAAGLDEAQVAILQQNEPGWDTSGRYGIIQLIMNR